jgi:acetoin:2,6-dichlorophenolindophenol oxidoreductase subunit alpha
MTRRAAEELRAMTLIRAFEERVSELVGTSEVNGLVHLGIGQEAVAVGVCGQLRAGDVVYSSHRGHGHFLAKGSPPGPLLAEIMGRAGGVCHGKGGSMHLVDVANGLFGATGVVGGTIPLALGAALVAKAAGGDDISVVFFGDGAAQSGHFHESLNLASLWGLPVLFVCENNGFAEFTPRSAHTKVARVVDLAAPYGITASVVEGNELGAVHAGAAALIAACRSGNGPAILECITYRLRGHYEGDPAKYRDAIQVREWKERDPIARFRTAALAAGDLDVREADDADRDARAAVDDATRFARESPWPDPAEVMTDVYA